MIPEMQKLSEMLDDLNDVGFHKSKSERFKKYKMSDLKAFDEKLRAVMCLFIQTLMKQHDLPEGDTVNLRITSKDGKVIGYTFVE